MTSQINYDAIDITFPIAGRDNDSEGFRGNFAATQSALEQARTEITELHDKAILSANIGDNTKATNNLQGSTISNGVYRQFDGVVFDAADIGAEGADIDLANGPFQILEINNPDQTLTFRNWTTNAYNKVRVHLWTSSESNITGTTFTSQNEGTIVYETGFPTLTLTSDNKHFVIEAWTYNVTPSAGGTIYVKYLGTY